MANVFIEPIGSIANWTVRSYDFDFSERIPSGSELLFVVRVKVNKFVLV